MAKVKLRIDGREAMVEEGATIMEAADSIGIRIPRLCHHPNLPKASGCRVCAVEVKGADGFAMSCGEPARDGMEVRTDTDAVKQAREDVLEFILANHPLDCPICDKSGECELQDTYFQNSRRRSRMAEPKVRKRKAVRVSERVVLDEERCIGCTRCLRFLSDVAGARGLGQFGRGEMTRISVAEGAVFDSPYSLCAVDVCPVGALTSADFRFRKRAWMLTSRETVCAGCARGCAAWLDSSGGEALRLRPRDAGDELGPWMCDEGRMTYRALDPSVRIQTPLLLRGGELEEATWEEALLGACGLISGSRGSDPVCLLSAGRSLEENIAAWRFAGEALGAKSILYSEEPEDVAFGDGLLRLSDRNPNSDGVKLMGAKRVGSIPKGCGAIVLGLPSDDDAMRIVEARPAFVILLASSRRGLGRWADVVLPTPTHFEQEGTFVGHGGRVRRFKKAIEATSESREAWEAMRLLSRGLGLGWDICSARAAREWGAGRFEGLGVALSEGVES